MTRSGEEVGAGPELVGLLLAHEEQLHTGPVDVALPGSRRHRGRGLGFPLEQGRTDRVVAVQGGGGVVRLGLLQRDEEGIDVQLGDVKDSFAKGVGLAIQAAVVERCEHLLALIAPVNLQRDVPKRRSQSDRDMPSLTEVGFTFRWSPPGSPIQANLLVSRKAHDCK